MNELNDYRVRFLDADGIPIMDEVISAENLTIVVQRAGQIAADIKAANFSIVWLPPKLS